MTSQPSHSRNRQNDFPKENVPELSQQNKVGSGDYQSLDKKADNQNNIKRLNGLASDGKVSQISVAGASNSNVHGFGGHPPPQKKPCSGKGVAAGKTPRDSNMKKKTFSGSGATGLAVRGSGSRTVTVKGKTSTHSKTNTKEKSSEMETNPSLTPFQGQGYALGGNTTNTVSRLLSLSVSAQPQPSSTSFKSRESKPHCSEAENSAGSDKDKEDGGCTVYVSQEGKTPKKIQKSLDLYVASPSPSQSLPNTVRCPVCETSVPERKINKHLDECVGNLSDNETVNETKDEILPSASRKVSEAGGSQCHEGELAELFPCPVCGECYSPSTINNHLDTHF